MMRRTTLAAAAAVAMAGMPLAVVPAVADGTGPFQAANLTGGCSAVELTVSTGYQFVVKPDVQVPRATSVVEEGMSRAISSPADPGDSADGLAALGLPEAENYINNGYPAAPSPLAGQGLSSLPAPFNSVGQALVQNPFNQALTYPWEHADAGYPNAQSPGTQTATLGNAPNPAFTDPSGVFALDAGTAQSVAGDGFAVADAGAGASVNGAAPTVPAGVSSLPALGITVGRVSAHSESHVLAGEVTQAATCMLDNVDIAVPGAPAIHIGAVDATVHAERLLSTTAATGGESIEFSGVTVNGQGATIDQRGLTIGGSTVPLNPSQGVAPPVTLPCPTSLPGAGTPCLATPTLSLAGTAVTERQPTADEYVVAATGATLTITSSTPIPNAIPPTGVSVTPTVYTIILASLASEAYGLPATSSSTSSAGTPASSSLGNLAGSFVGVVGGSLGSIGGGSPRAGSPGRPVGHPGTPAVASTLGAISVPPAARLLILGIASLLEAMLLVGVGRNYLRSRRLVPAPTDSTDLP